VGDAGDAGEKTWRLESIFHFVVNATDFERSLDFYTTLGFRVLRDNRDVVWPSSVAQNFGMPVAQGRGALLAIGDGELHTRLDLIEWLEPSVDPDPQTAPEHQVPRVMALRTHDVQAAYDDLSARGIEFVSTPRSFRRAGIVNVCTCRDPDGLLVELIEYEPGQLGSRIDHLDRRGLDREPDAHAPG
jgi:catechol 2,3-dioxygenase-like lactoylglutathione lyase family enzyme